MKSHIREKSQALDLETSLDLVIAGGGTGGHIYPGIAVAKEVKRQIPRASILFIGTSKGLEAKIIPKEGFALETIDIQGFKNKEWTQKLQTLYKFPYAVYRSRRFLKEFQPDVVFGTGGYVSVPVIYAAYLLKIPTLILEPNRRPGLANKLLSKSVNKIAICFEDSSLEFPREKIIFTGNPVRREFVLIGETPPPDRGEKFNILVIGGSLGAKKVNYAVMNALKHLMTQREKLAFTHQTGPADYTYVKTGYKKKGFRAEVFEFIDNMPKMYAKSHLIICRAGASTIAELRASHRVAVLIPYPYGDKHQEFNAQALEDEGLAKVIFQSRLSGKTLSEAILYALHHPEAFAQVWSGARDTESQTAAERVVATCLQLANKEMSLIV